MFKWDFKKFVTEKEAENTKNDMLKWDFKKYVHKKENPKEKENPKDRMSRWDLKSKTHIGESFDAEMKLRLSLNN